MLELADLLVVGPVCRLSGPDDSDKFGIKLVGAEAST